MTDGFSWVAQEAAFVVVDKQPGIDFHTDSGVPGLAARVGTALGEPLWPVHRLDKMTSGLVLLARSAAAAGQLSELFARRQMNKFYLAIGQGKPKKKQGLIIGDMARSRRKTWKLLASTDNPAVTQFFSQGLGAGRRLYLLKPHSGKTHQLRVALKSLGSPVLGDDVYGGGSADRGYLHAFQLHFCFADKSWTFASRPSVGEHFLAPVTQDALTHYDSPGALAWPQLPHYSNGSCL